MSHSASRPPLDPVSRLDVLIRAAGGRVERGAGRTREPVIDSSGLLVCRCGASVRLYQSTSSRCLERRSRASLMGGGHVNSVPT